MDIHADVQPKERVIAKYFLLVSQVKEGKAER